MDQVVKGMLESPAAGGGGAGGAGSHGLGLVFDSVVCAWCGAMRVSECDAAWKGTCMKARPREERVLHLFRRRRAHVFIRPLFFVERVASCCLVPMAA